MKRWQTLLSTALVGTGILMSSLALQPAHSQENIAGRRVLYLFSLDFPQRGVNLLDPKSNPAVKQTEFWQLMDKEMRATPDLALTENMEEANYRVELRCAGIAHCASLAVDIKNMQRDVLASFTIKGIAPLWGLFGGRPDLPVVAHTLTQRLDERFKILDQGGFGHTD